jgi:hypothetical protein
VAGPTRHARDLSLLDLLDLVRGFDGSHGRADSLPRAAGVESDARGEWEWELQVSRLNSLEAL